MTITFRKNFDLNKIGEQGLRNIEKTLEREFLSIRTEIGERTRQGHTIEGGSMAAYAESTRKRKAREGKSTRVNLTERGDLLRGMKVNVARVAKDIIAKMFFFSSEATKARAHQYGVPGNNLPARPFFGLSRQQLRKLTQKLKEAFK